MSDHPFIKHLLEDHEKQKELGKKLVEATSPAERDSLRKEYYEELYPHMVGEEASFFKDLKDLNDGEISDEALEGMQEHHVGKMVLRELMDLDTEGPVFKAKAKVLDELNRHHLDEEEDDIFSYMRKNCSEAQLDEWFERYEAAEEKAKS